MANLNTIKRPAGLIESAKRVGRGQSSGKGKQSGRGGKGQTARAGAKIRPAMRDIIKKIPKRRGYGKNRGRTVVPKVWITLPLSRLDTLFADGGEVSMKTLAEKGIVTRKIDCVKVVGGGETKKKFALKNVLASASAKTAIEKAGGSIQ